MNRYYLTAEQTGQRDVQPRPYFVEDRPDDPSWLAHERLAWERGDDPYLPYHESPRRGALPADFPREDMPDAYPRHGYAHDDWRSRHRQPPPGVYERGDWPGQALSEFFRQGEEGGRQRRRYPAAERSMWSQTDHSGRGPKGYQRSDERIVEEICERLSDDPAIDASEISVRCEAGKVVLEGSVDDRAIKHEIEDMVDACAGVTAIDNRLTVDRTRARDRFTGAGYDGLPARW